MNEAITPVEEGDFLPGLFVVGKATGVGREEIRSAIGAPFAVETDSSRTFGGEEEWWAYRVQGDDVIAVCLAVPYKEVRMLTSSPNSLRCMAALKELLSAWALEIYERAYPA